MDFSSHFPVTLIDYDTEKYNFKKLVEELFNHELSTLKMKLHKVSTMEDNSNTNYHKLFYNKLNNGWNELSNMYDKFMKDIVVDLVNCDFIYQYQPSIRINYPNNYAAPEYHCDTMPGYDHPEGEINFIIPLTDMYDTNSIWVESEPGKKDFKPVNTKLGQLLIFNGNKCYHGNELNKTGKTRVSFDFRIIFKKRYNNYIINNPKYSVTTNKKFIIGEYYKELCFNICFSPAWGFTSKELTQDYLLQSPNSSGKWQHIKSVYNIDEADILIIQDNCDIDTFNKFKKTRRFYFSREAIDRISYPMYKNLGITDCSFWNKDGSYLWTKWIYKNKYAGGIGKTYDELINLKSMNKTKKICCILSNKTMNEGHILRKHFMYEFMRKYPDYIDLYGTCEFANKTLKDNDKFECLKNYEYCIGFDNQDEIKNFFGTQMTDSILCWTIPIFWCGTKLDNYFPEKSFISFNVRDWNEIDRLYNLLNNDSYKERLKDLKNARLNILNKYNMWPTIVNEINKNIFVNQST
jgi:hypothetical protein